jgi:hypothetical protein
MSTFEFQPAQQFLDYFVTSHSIMIRGVNKDIGTEESNLLIRKIFEERFGPKKVVSVKTIRKTDNVQKLYRKLQVYK